MLKELATFPGVGAYATLQGHRGTVRIQRINADGTLLVSGATLSARSVALDRLSAAPKPRAQQGRAA